MMFYRRDWFSVDNIGVSCFARPADKCAPTSEAACCGFEKVPRHPGFLRRVHAGYVLASAPRPQGPVR